MTGSISTALLTAAAPRARWDDVERGSRPARSARGRTGATGGRPQVDRSFVSEAELALALAQGGRALFAQFDRAELEVPSRLGIADLVFARTDASRLSRRLACGLDAILTPSASQALMRVGDGGPVTTRLLRQLRETGHLVDAGGGVTRAPGLQDPYLELIAVEAKLDDWRRAEAQAERYRTYADAAYVALPLERISPVAREYFERTPVGLLAVGAQVEVVIPARVASPSEPWRRLLVSEVLTTRLPGRGTPDATLGMPASRYPRLAPALSG